MMNEKSAFVWLIPAGLVPFLLAIVLWLGSLGNEAAGWWVEWCGKVSSWSEDAFKIAFFLLILSMVTDFIDFIKKLP